MNYIEVLRDKARAIQIIRTILFHKFQSCQQIHVLQISVAVLVWGHYFWWINLDQRFGL